MTITVYFQGLAKAELVIYQYWFDDKKVRHSCMLLAGIHDFIGIDSL